MSKTSNSDTYLLPPCNGINMYHLHTLTETQVQPFTFHGEIRQTKPAPLLKQLLLHF